ncbi:hypothetical protein OSB04_001383, partial [Centaurea solstitialis]
MVGNNSHGRIEIKVHSIPPPPPPPLFRSPRQWHPWLIPCSSTSTSSSSLSPCTSTTAPPIPTLASGPKYFNVSLSKMSARTPFSALLPPQRMGALDADKVIQERQQWRILTCMWLHAGVFHIFANMLSLLSVGIRLEQEFGFRCFPVVRIGSVYILSGIGGSLLSAVFIRRTISVGASGALFGLLGAMLSELLTNWKIYTNKFAALTTLILMILINLMVGMLPHLDNFAHIGGFVTGFLLGFILLIKPHFHWVNQGVGPFDYYSRPMRKRYKIYQYIFFVLSMIALLAMFTIGFVLLFRKVDANDYCSWCHYLTCIPTALWSCDPQCNVSTRSGNQLDLTCLNNGKSKSYMLPDGNDM